jgi:ABC-2 type transport system ATP-binding protein
VGLDPKQIIEVRKLIKSLAEDHTIILSTHILPEVSMTCDRVTIINQGRVIATNTPDQLMADLTGNLSYQLEVSGDAGQLETLTHQLQSLPMITDVETTPVPQRSNHLQITIRSNSAEEIGHHLATAIAAQGINLYEMRRLRPTLEDVFLELITSEASSESPESQALKPTEDAPADSSESAS